MARLYQSGGRPRTVGPRSTLQSLFDLIYYPAYSLIMFLYMFVMSLVGGFVGSEKKADKEKRRDRFDPPKSTPFPVMGCGPSS